ncbi:hypothetical protein L917_19622 [Phytophthora nicotianae]|uniref:Uncharacterized protein n=1 Tax=Phytophthora nicotianae TaxID=4792 RepID=W2MBL0_PHYNI|nr:hypothetical protein L917_19623 [Phytophthora nicotianae]ETL79835.1 hypothetical protein L917_19622 [Phytophthora nicotianae]ETM33033.1 hypothetical protein L914_19668 [Phytophthora nicotianae]
MVAPSLMARKIWLSRISPAEPGLHERFLAIMVLTTCPAGQQL